MITRRRVVLAIGAVALAAPLASFAQQQGKVWRIGILVSGSTAAFGRLIEAFTRGLAELGYVEGKNIVIERRFAEGNPARLPVLAADLVQQKIDVIFAPSTPAVQAVIPVAGTIPIVFATVGNPVTSGFAASLARLKCSGSRS